MPSREHTSDLRTAGTPGRAGKPELGWSRLEGFLAWGWRLARDACPGAAAGQDGGAGVSEETQKRQEEPSQKFGPDWEIWPRAWLPPAPAPEPIPCSH